MDMSSSTALMSPKNKRRSMDVLRTAISALWIGYPAVALGWRVFAGTFTGWIFVEVIILTFACAFASSKAKTYKELFKKEEMKSLPPHKYDEGVMYWERGDEVKVQEEEDEHSSRTVFFGFTDENTVVLYTGRDRSKFRNIIKSAADPNIEDFAGHFEEYSLPELYDYNNSEAEERKEEIEAQDLVAKVEGSVYNETLEELRELQNREQQIRADLEDSEDIREFEEKHGFDQDLDKLESEEVQQIKGRSKA